MKRILTISAVVVLLSASSAIAQNATARACASDVKTLCAGVEPGQGRIAGCIKERFKDVAGPCQNVLATAAAGAKACAADIKQKCADARRRVERVACVKSALPDLGEPCRALIARMAAARK